MSSRAKAILGGVATVVVLAAVILGLSAVSSSKKSAVVPPSIQYTASQQSDQAYQQGQQALASGDTTSAIADFKRAVELDPNNAAAQARLTEVTTAQSSSSSSSSNSSSASKASSSKAATTTPSTSASDWTSKPVANLKTLLPSKFAGYVMGQRVIVTPDAVISATGASPTSQASHIEWTVHDRNSASGATAFVTTATTKLYPSDSAPVTVNGVAATFGTDGAQFATVIFRRGRYVFQVVLTAPAGSPGNLKDLATQAAAAFPTAP